jgi:hypothetical protein
MAGSNWRDASSVISPIPSNRFQNVHGHPGRLAGLVHVADVARAIGGRRRR